ncbi:MAG: hypothetical protein MI922_28805, partial [Bacteroidales bacterium]|nr:hypothetical protein [Bacteroidales bacterium]
MNKTISYILLMVFFGTILLSCQEGENNGLNYQKLIHEFKTPNDTNNVWCYYYWINDHLSKEGITNDLIAMKE